MKREAKRQKKVVDGLQKKLNKFTEQMNTELDDFQNHKFKALKAILLDFIKLQLQYAEKVWIEEWVLMAVE